MAFSGQVTMTASACDSPAPLEHTRFPLPACATSKQPAQEATARSGSRGTQDPAAASLSSPLRQGLRFSATPLIVRSGPCSRTHVPTPPRKASLRECAQWRLLSCKTGGPSSMPLSPPQIALPCGSAL